MPVKTRDQIQTHIDNLPTYIHSIAVGRNTIPISILCAGYIIPSSKIYVLIGYNMMNITSHFDVCMRCILDREHLLLQVYLRKVGYTNKQLDSILHHSISNPSFSIFEIVWRSLKAEVNSTHIFSALYYKRKKVTKVIFTSIYTYQSLHIDYITYCHCLATAICNEWHNITVILLNIGQDYCYTLPTVSYKPQKHRMKRLVENNIALRSILV